MSIYCVYLTVYSGNKLPPFYIGSTSVKRIIEKKYHGSIASKKYKDIWKSELKSHPELFKTIIICTFESRKEAIEKENKLQKLLNVIRSPLYINQSTAQVNGYCGRIVKGKDNPFFGKKHTEETRKRLSDTHKGENHCFYGKKRPEHSAALKGRPKPEGFGEKISKANKGKPHGTGKGNRSNYMIVHFDKFVDEHVRVLKVYFTKPTLTEQYNVKSANGKMITYDYAFCKEYSSVFEMTPQKIRKIILGKSKDVYEEAMRKLNANSNQK